MRFADDESDTNRVRQGDANDRNIARRPPSSESGASGRCDDHIRFDPHQILCKRGQPIHITLGVPLFEYIVRALLVAKLTQARGHLAEKLPETDVLRTQKS